MKQLVAAAAMSMLAPEGDAPGPEGRWQSPGGNVVIVIAPCGVGALCGRVDWASDKAVADARKAGTETLVGTELLSSFRPDGKGRWKGRLFVPDLRQRSKATLQLTAPDEMKVSGCAVGGILCKSQRWRRVEADR